MIFSYTLLSGGLICYLESNVVKLASCKISILQLVPVAEHADLSLNWSETQRQVFLHQGPNESIMGESSKFPKS